MWERLRGRQACCIVSGPCRHDVGLPILTARRLLIARSLDAHLLCRLTDNVCSVLRLSKPLKEQYAKVPDCDGTSELARRISINGVL